MVVDVLFLKISGAIYYGRLCERSARAEKGDMRTPGVPQISVSRWNRSSSITRLRPKSAIMISASSAGVRNSRFSGFKSGKELVDGGKQTMR